MTEEKPVMKAGVANENGMAEVLMRNKKLVAQPMFVVAEVVRAPMCVMAKVMMDTAGRGMWT